jgi:hypothetical protein
VFVALEFLLDGISGPQGLEALEEEKGFIAALKAPRHPKASFSSQPQSRE